MTVPLVILAILSVIGGVIGIDQYIILKFHSVEHTPAFAEMVMEPFHQTSTYFGIGAFVLGLGLAYVLYAKAETDPLPAKLPGLMAALRNKFYFDELYARIIASTHEAMAEMASQFDRWIIAGLVVRGTHGATEFIGRALRLVQTGNLQTYTFLFAAGIALALYLVLLQ